MRDYKVSNDVEEVQNDKRTFRTNTEKIQKRLQRTVNGVCAKAGIKSPQIVLTMLKLYGKTPFYTLAVAIDTAEIEYEEAKEKVLPIFNPGHTSSAKLPKPIRLAFTPFLYNEDDKENFKDVRWTSKFKLNRSQGMNLADLVEPSLIKYNDGSSSIVFIIDPVRVCWEIAKPEDRSIHADDYIVNLVEMKMGKNDFATIKYEIIFGGYKNKKFKNKNTKSNMKNFLNTKMR